MLFLELGIHGPDGRYGNFDIIDSSLTLSFGPFLRPFSAPTHPTLPECRGLLGVHANWELIGAWNPIL